jgi:hypothetical protein
MLFHFVYQWASLAALLATAAVAIWRGAWPERAGATAMIAAWVLSALFQSSLQRWGVKAGVMTVDVLLLAALLTIALTSSRWWPMWATGFQAMNVVVHLAVMADAKVWGWAYYVAGSVFSYLTMIALFIGAISLPRRARSRAD